VVTQKTLLWSYYDRQNIKNSKHNDGWERDDYAQTATYGIATEEAPIMKGNPCNAEIVKKMLKKIEVENRSELRNVTKQATPMHELILRRIYIRFSEDGGMNTHELQIWTMMTIAFVLCLRCNELLMIRFAHLEFDHVRQVGCVTVRLPWRKSDQTGSECITPINSDVVRILIY
jgi:hypothetical protein